MVPGFFLLSSLKAIYRSNQIKTDINRLKKIEISNKSNSAPVTNKPVVF